ncbi:MobF family relaxase [Sporichthya brevicatena]|uniref:MobF family relaxase n=1 Tax=Sporichthya brevicatena TaxID=171442 RepID=A0ABN1HCF6_9ACTN
MLSSAKIGTSSWRYYTAGVACAATDYYIGTGEAPGRWSGRGLGELGLTAGATVAEAELEALFGRALHPVTGARLGRAWRADGVTGFDLTFSAPKSVSSLWALADPDMASEVRAAHRAAVETAMSYLDLHASWSRSGTDGVDQVGTAGLVASSFEHRTSRCGDPQLHTHTLVVNKVRCTDGRWRTLDATELYHHKKSAGTIYQAALRSELHARLSVVFAEPNAHGQAEIAGIPAALMKLWSKRTAQIEPEAAAKIAEYENSFHRSLTGAERAAVTKTAVLTTRPGKSYPDPGSLHTRWVAEARRAGHDPAAVVADVRAAADRRARDAGPGSDAGTAAAAVMAAAETRSTFSRADVVAQVAARLPVDARGAAAVLRTVEALTDQGLGLDDAVAVGRQPHGVTARASDARWAGAQVLAAEARVLSLAERGRAGGYGQARIGAAMAALGDAGLSAGTAGGFVDGLDGGQWSAAFKLTTGGDFLSVLTAPAGAGKTSTLGAATRAWQACGYRVIGLAPSARAAAELAAATGGVADTLAKWRLEHERLGLLLPEQRARTVLDARTVVVVDEASMASTLDLDALITAAARRAAKVVLVGDPAQIGVVNGPGGMLAALAAAGHGHELGTVHRFTHEWEAGASLALRAGDPQSLTEYQNQERLHACPDGDAAIAAIHSRWAGERAQGREVLMMARTRADVDALNLRARNTAMAAGEVHGPVVRIGERDWQSGDLLRTRRNDRTLITADETADRYVRNGDRWRVFGVEDFGLRVEHIQRGDRVFLPAAYVAVHAEYGWASTITAAQGATVDVGLVLVRPGIDREHLYVALTRGRAANHAYITPDAVTGPAPAEDHHGLPSVKGWARSSLQHQAHEVLSDALTRTGAQDTAHTVRERARDHVLREQRRLAEEAASGATEMVAAPTGHTALAALLAQAEARRSELARSALENRRAEDAARAELARTPGWRRGRRKILTDAISSRQDASNEVFRDRAQLDREIYDLSRQVQRDTRDREYDGNRRDLRAARPRADPIEGYLAPAKSEQWRDGVIAAAGHDTTAVLRRIRERQQSNALSVRRSSAALDFRELGRDDTPGIGR